MKNKSIKRIFVAFLTLSFMIPGCWYISGDDAQAATDTRTRFQEVEYATFETCIGSQTAPEYEPQDGDNSQGYLFAGWYKDDETTNIASLNDVSSVTKVKAKFVSAAFSRVVCQEKAGFQGTEDTTNLRMISLVDSTNYKAVGFNIYGRNADGSEWTQYEYNKDGTNKAESGTVYSDLQKYHEDGTEKEKVTPAEVFGTEAAGFKFTTVNLKGIPKSFFDTILVIKPYWITTDGTYVEGMGEFNRAKDSVDGIVNISVNIKDATDIAAGILDVTYDSEKYTFVGVDYGRVFDEMEHSQADGIVKCVGNVSDISTNSTKANDIYMNIRFTETEAGKSLEVGSTVFEVGKTKKAFCDNEENTATVSAWDIRY